MNEHQPTSSELRIKEPHPWDQLSREPDKKFNAFTIYLDLGPARTYKKTAESLRVSERTVANYAKSWDWRVRAGLYDAFIFERRKNQFLESVERLDIMKFEQKITFSSVIQSIINSIMPYLDSNYHCYHNPEIIRRVNFIMTLSKSILSLYQMTDFSLNPKSLNDKTMHNFNIMSIFQKYNTKGDAFMNEVKAFNSYLEEVGNVLLPPLGDKEDPAGPLVYNPEDVELKHRPTLMEDITNDYIDPDDFKDDEPAAHQR